jgi:hypothetical protein
VSRGCNSGSTCNSRSNGWVHAMPAKSSLSPILNKVDLLVAEITHLRTAGPHFRIVHRARMPGSSCLPGEEVVACFLCHRGREYQLRLSSTLLLIFDFLAHHSRIALCAKQIELGIRADPFYRQHAKNANGRPALVRRIPRSAVREHIKRLHHALALVFHEANLSIDPRRVLVVDQTVSNSVQYKLRATCHWTHIDLTSPECQPLR